MLQTTSDFQLVRGELHPNCNHILLIYIAIMQICISTWGKQMFPVILVSQVTPELAHAHWLKNSKRKRSPPSSFILTSSHSQRDLSPKESFIVYWIYWKERTDISHKGRSFSLIVVCHSDGSTYSSAYPYSRTCSYNEFTCQTLLRSHHGDFKVRTAWWRCLWLSGPWLRSSLQHRRAPQWPDPLHL